jgi:hypothetical protein
VHNDADGPRGGERQDCIIVELHGSQKLLVRRQGRLAAEHQSPRVESDFDIAALLWCWCRQHVSWQPRRELHGGVEQLGMVHVHEHNVPGNAYRAAVLYECSAGRRVGHDGAVVHGVHHYLHGVRRTAVLRRVAHCESQLQRARGRLLRHFTHALKVYGTQRCFVLTHGGCTAQRQGLRRNRCSDIAAGIGERQHIAGCAANDRNSRV